MSLDWVTYTANQVVEVTTQTVGGIDFLVAPVVMLVAGVLNDEELVPADELAHHFRSWNGRPVVINHPKNNRGSFISANDPEILDTVGIGMVYSAFIENDSLKGEIWINLPMADGLEQGKEIVNGLRSGMPLEVSTAYLRDVEDTSGTFDGKSYSKITRNISPDHLALLPGAEGACSWADGCGTPRVNEEVSMPELELPCWLTGALELMQFNDEGLDERAQRIRDAWWVMFRNGSDFDEFGDPWPRTVLEDSLIVETEKGLLAYPYTTLEDGTVEFSDPIQVEIEYVEKGQIQEDSDMSLVEQIVEDGSLGLTADDLDGMSESGLTKLLEGITSNEAADGEAEEDHAESIEEEDVQANETPCDNGIVADVIERVGGADAFMQFVESVQSNASSLRDGLIDGILASNITALTKDQLNELSDDTLVTLSKSITPVVSANYGGQGGGPVVNTGVQTVELPPMFV